MKHQKQHTKRGIAMIELIFALVIIGLALMNAPILIQQSSRSNHVALQQESIAAGAAHTTVVLSMSWDEENRNKTIGRSPILEVNRTTTPTNLLNFNDGNLSGLKGVSGRVSGYGGTVIFPSTHLSPDANETDFSKFDDVDDFHGSTLGITVYNTEETSADIGDYVDQTFTMNTTVNYSEDNPSLGWGTNTIYVGNRIGSTALTVPSNIKFITMNLTSSTAGLEKNITLSAFSCNIGTYEPQGEDQK